VRNIEKAAQPRQSSVNAKTAKQMLNVGLVRRIKGSFSPTNFGLVVYHAQLIVEAGVSQ
jgi:hypothetical protein